MVPRRERRVCPHLSGEETWRVAAVAPWLRVCGVDAMHSQRQIVRVEGTMAIDPDVLSQ